MRLLHVIKSDASDPRAYWPFTVIYWMHNDELFLNSGNEWDVSEWSSSSYGIVHTDFILQYPTQVLATVWGSGVLDIPNSETQQGVRHEWVHTDSGYGCSWCPEEGNMTLIQFRDHAVDKLEAIRGSIATYDDLHN